MTARDQMREMLEQLMGAEALGEGTSITDYKDDRLCPYFLAGVCPYDLFSNTKSDLGACNKAHSEPMKDQYQEALKQGKSEGFEVELFKFLDKLVADMDRKIHRAKQQRLAQDGVVDEELTRRARAVEEVCEEMGKTLAEAERLGSEGQVEESLRLMKQVEELKTKRTQCEAAYRERIPVGHHQQQKLRVCEVCGSMLSILDNDRRLADHFGGKLHMGFVKARELVKELEPKVGEVKDSSRRRSSSRERSRRSRSRERRRSHSRDRDYRRDDRRRRDYDRYDDRRRRDYDDRGRRDSDRSRGSDRHRYRRY